MSGAVMTWGRLAVAALLLLVAGCSAGGSMRPAGMSGSGGAMSSAGTGTDGGSGGY